MLNASQTANIRYYTSELSLKRQTIRENGTQNHGPYDAQVSAGESLGFPNEPTGFTRQPGCQLRRRIS